MSAHTPGPWLLTEDGEILSVENPGDIASIYHMHTPTGLANAHLIAAAPELLALLKRALGDVEDHANYKFAAEIEACIAKAEGRA